MNEQIGVPAQSAVLVGVGANDRQRPPAVSGGRSGGSSGMH
jgi:hypothetical protein